jgi:hemerythrin-like domain-containing protein
MKPTESLVHEHQVIMLVVAAAEREADRIENTGQLRADRVEKMVDFFRNFADRCHHGKEEKHLFALLQSRGMSADSGPIAVMLSEHNRGRALVSAISRALQATKAGHKAAPKEIARDLRAYVELLRGHMDKENGALFPMSDRLLTEADQVALAEAFENVEAEEMGQGTHEKYHRLAHELDED